MLWMSKNKSRCFIFTILSPFDWWQFKELTDICWKKRRKKRQKYSVTAVLVPHLCPNSLISGRKWDSTYQMRALLQFFNLCFESCLILNQMKRLDVIFLLTKCIVIYNHNNTSGISLRIVYYFSASSHILHTPHILHILQMTTKNFVQMLCSTFFALREICSTFFCRSWTLFNYFCPSWTLFNFFSSPELCSTDSTSYTDTSLPPTYMSFLRCSIFPLKIVVWYLFREISSSLSLTDIYSKCNNVSFIWISTIFPILCRGHTACARQFYGKPR